MTASGGRALAGGDLHRRELVGLHAQIVRSCNPEIVGASGRVVDETMNMLVLQARGPTAGGKGRPSPSTSPSLLSPRPRPGRRSYPKAGSVWRFSACAPAPAPGRRAGAPMSDAPPAAAPGHADLDGSAIARRPEDRLRSGGARRRRRPLPQKPAAAAGRSEGGGAA